MKSIKIQLYVWLISSTVQCTVVCVIVLILKLNNTIQMQTINLSMRLNSKRKLMANLKNLVKIIETRYLRVRINSKPSFWIYNDFQNRSDRFRNPVCEKWIYQFYKSSVFGRVGTRCCYYTAAQSKEDMSKKDVFFTL